VDGTQRHDDRLLMMFADLKTKRDRLMRELAEVDRDLDAVWRTASVELRQRQAAATSRATLDPDEVRRSTAARLPQQGTTALLRGTLVLAAPTQPGPEASEADGPEDIGPVLVSPRTPFKGQSIPSPPETLAALATLGPVRDDEALPPAVDAQGQRLEVAGMPTGGARLAEAKAAVRSIADEARKAPPGKGGRKLMSSRGLVPGEPMMPALRNVLRAARRPLTSLEAALAMLEARSLAYEGPELVAVVNRVSALFGQEAAKGNMRRHKQEGTRVQRWELVEKETPFDPKAHMRGARSHPSGSTG
jgi:hypothetical protein